MRVAAALLVAASLTAGCGGHAQPRIAGHYLVYVNRVAAPRVVLARVDGTHAHTLANGDNPALSPDGRWVAFVSPDQKLFVVSTRGGKPRFLARIESWPIWSPTSDRLATLTNKALISVDLHGHVTVLNRNPDAGSGGWAFSPDGRWLVYTTDGGLVASRATGGSGHAVTRGSDLTPVWGERWIAFARYAPLAGIWRIRPDGSGLRRVVPPPTHPERNGIWGFYPIAWAPHEDALLAELGMADAWDVGIRVEVARGTYRHVHGYPVSLSRDGRLALLSVGRNGPYEIITAPFGRRGRVRVLARGDVCCPSWNR